MVAFPTVLKGVHYLCFHAGRTVRTLTRKSGTLDLLNHQQSNNNNNNNNVDSYTCVKGLMKCIATKDLALGREVHHGIIRNNLHLNIYVVNTLIRMYALCGELADARQIFNEMVKRDIVSWNTMVGGYAQRGHAREAFALFCQMQHEGLKPNRITYLSILPACASPATLKWGKEVHAHIVSAGYQSDVRVETALLKMYAKCGSMKDAREIFDRMATTTRDVVSWTVLIGGYAKSGLGDEAFKLFDQMQQEGVAPNRITYLSVLNACANPSNLEWGKKIHSHALGAGFVSDGSVGNALVNMYAKCGSMEDARQVFDGMVKRDVVSWTAMIGGYAESGQSEKAFQMFQEMQQHGLQPNRITYMTVLNACTSSGALDWVKEIHTHIIESGLTSDTSVNNALVNMYAKCGSIEDARVVFDEMGSKRDIISWNAMIGGYALHGRGQDALRIFEEMLRVRVRPDAVTFVSVLSACSHAGLVEEGHRYFTSMSRVHGLTPRMDHYSCMVDILGRAGYLHEAEKIIKEMPVRATASIWGALLGACRTHGDVIRAEQAAEQCLLLDSQNSGTYILLANTYAAAGKWDSVAKVRKLMVERGVKKDPGRSWIEIDKRVHSFIADDKSHPQTEEIYAELQRLTKEMKNAGYIFDTQSVIHELDEQEKQEAICHHSEKLAIAYGLVSTPPETPIRVFKNLRVCADCHSATKFISKLMHREIIARDSNRFHHFKDGVCSCGDYW